MPNDDYYSELDLNGDRRPIIDADGMRKVNPTGSGSLSINRKDNTTVGTDSVAVGYDCEASGLYSFAEGQETVASGPESHAEGRNTTASGGDSHAEGLLTTASGIQSHAEGDYTIASGDHSHSEGMRTVASGICSHAEGYYTVASSGDSHAEGLGCQATNLAAHAEGDHTIAASAYQHTSGRFNIVDQSDNYIEIVGNGTADNARSNARKLDWQGNETIAGDFYFNGGSDSLTTQLANKADTSTIPTDADQISYDNQTSGLVATDVQAAIDETFATIPTDAVNIDYDNTTSGLSATDVQAAIDEVNTIASGVSDKMDKQDPTGSGSLSINRKDNTTVGASSVALGYNCEASGITSFAVGDTAQATAACSHAEGDTTIASGMDSHAEGHNTTASGRGAHAENGVINRSGGGFSAPGNVASGDSSHAEGLGTIAASQCQHVSGKFNVADNYDAYAEIIGNGTADDARSNARTLKWNGDEMIAGDFFFNGSNSSLSTQLANKQNLLTAGSNIDITSGTISATDTKPGSIVQDQTGSVELSHNAWKQIKTFDLTKGLYIIHAAVVFQGVNSTGIRAFAITTTSAASGGGINTTRAPGSSNDTNIHMTIPVEVTAASQTFYINAYQNAGTGVTLTAQPRFEYVKLR